MKSIRYIENRDWFLGANILLQDAVSRGQTIDLSKFEVDYPEQESEDILRLPNVAEVVVQSTSLWTMYTKYPDALVFRFDAETDKVIRQYVGDNAGYPMLSLRLAIHASGVLQLLSEFKIPQTDDQKNLETITDLIAESFDRLYPFLA